MSTILDLRRHLTHAEPIASVKVENEPAATDRQVKQEVDGEEGVVRVKPEPDTGDELAAADPPSPSPPKKKLKTEDKAGIKSDEDVKPTVPPPVTNEYDALLDDGDDDLFASIDI